MRTKGCAFWQGVCTSCFCTECGMHPCNCRRSCSTQEPKTSAHKTPVEDARKNSSKELKTAAQQSKVRGEEDKEEQGEQSCAAAATSSSIEDMQQKIGSMSKSIDALRTKVKFLEAEIKDIKRKKNAGV